MIFINKYADYSANKIGTVEIPIEIDPVAEAIMGNYTKSLTIQQQVVFSQFVVGLKSAGIYDKIEFMYLPALAGTVSEAFYEVINDVEQDLTDTSTYGQYSLTEHGLKSVYDSSHTYTQKKMNITRSTYGCTISSLFHAMGSLSPYVYTYLMGAYGQAAVLRAVTVNRKYINTSSYNNDQTTDTFTSNITAANSLVHSIITDTNSWLPSSTTSKAICNGEVGTTTTQIASAMVVGKSNDLYLAGYGGYGTSFQCPYGSLDALIISTVLDGVMCTDDGTKDMSVRMDELLTAFKTSFWA